MIVPLLLALALGFKHSYDADHILVVSTLLGKTKSFRQSVSMSLSWAAGHMLTAGIISIILFSFKETFLTPYLKLFDTVVGVMLIVLGVIALNEVRKMHFHPHRHGRTRHVHPHERGGHYHKHMFGIGIVHGLASNDELLILLTTLITLSSIWALLLGIAVFSIGVVLGMVVYAYLFSAPLLVAHGELLRKSFILVSGGLSIAYGVATLIG